jgi:sugar phosphate isomerase/epimerase
MKLGFLTACFPNRPLEEIVPWAAAHGFQALEVGVWPPANTRDYAAVSIDVAGLTKPKANKIKTLFAEHKIEISCLTYCDNNLDPDLKARQARLDHLVKVIDAAGLLGVRNVSAFIGRNPQLNLTDNLKEAQAVFAPILKHAASKDVRIGIENCPMPGWQVEGLIGNVAYSPAIWDELFALLPDDNFGLNFDPSHLYWLQVDYLDAIKQYAERIFHVHAKDAEVMDGDLAYRGIGTLTGWWRYRMPGWGEIDWRQLISTLIESGYNDTLSIEHEDPIWEGSPDKVEGGLILGQRYLSQFLL